MVRKKKPVAPVKQFNPAPVVPTEYTVDANTVVITSTFKPWYNGDKVYYLLFDAVPTVNQRYYLNNYPEIDASEIIGIEIVHYANNSTIDINGRTYNLLSDGWFGFVQLSLYDKDNEPILYRRPLWDLYNQPAPTQMLEIKDFAQLKIATGLSYLEFVAVMGTPTPFAIPLKFIH